MKRSIIQGKEEERVIYQRFGFIKTESLQTLIEV